MTDPNTPIGGAPSSPPPAQPPTEISSAAPSTQQIPNVTEAKKPKGKLAARFAIIFAMIAVLGGVAFASYKIFFQSSGFDSPEEAADAFFEALDSEDPVGVLEVMLPSEREALIDPTFAVAEELTRLEIFSEKLTEDETFNLNDAFTIEVLEEPEYKVTPVKGVEGANTVQVISGKIELTADSDAFNELIGERFPGVDTIPAGEKTTSKITFKKDGVTTTEDGNTSTSEEPFTFVSKEEDGNHYVSLWYSVAELIRAESDLETESLTNKLIPAGAESPEEAVEQMLLSLTELELEEMMATLDPEEFAVLYDYWELYGEDASDNFALLKSELEQTGIDWQIESFSTRSEERDGRTVVVVNGVKGSATIQADFNATINFDISPDFVKIGGTFETQEGTVTFSLEATQTSFEFVIEGDSSDFEDEFTFYLKIDGTFSDESFDASYTGNLDGAIGGQDVSATFAGKIGGNNTNIDGELKVRIDGVEYTENGIVGFTANESSSIEETETIFEEELEEPLEGELDEELEELIEIPENEDDTSPTGTAIGNFELDATFELDIENQDLSIDAQGNFMNPDEVEDYELRLSIDEQNCLTATMTGEEPVYDCNEQYSEIFNWSRFAGASNPLNELQEDFSDLEFQTPAITVVKRDNLWYVSGYPTVMYGAADLLKAFEPGDFEKLEQTLNDIDNEQYGTFDEAAYDL